MPFDVLIHITEDSQRGCVIQQVAAEQHVTPEQAVEQIIDVGVKAHALAEPQMFNGKPPAEMLLGLFSSQEDADLIDEVTAVAYKGRSLGSIGDIGTLKRVITTDLYCQDSRDPEVCHSRFKRVASRECALTRALYVVTDV